MAGKLWRRLTDPSPAVALVVFYRSMATMMNAGIPLTRALAMLGTNCENLEVGEGILACASLVNSGQSLSRSMARQGHLFPLTDVAMISVGEQTGAIHRVLDRMARQREQSHALHNRMRSALVYPVFVFSVCLTLLLVIPALAFEGLLKFFREMNLELPWSTKLMLALCDLGKSPLFWLAAVGAVGGLGFALRKLWQQPTWRRQAERGLRRLPGVGPALSQAAAGEFCRLLAAMYESGIPLLKALEITAGTSPSLLVRDALVEGMEGLKQGDSLAGSLRKAGGMPPMIYHMLEAGEHTGALSSLLGSAARLCEESLDESLALAESLIQPVMMAFLGGLAGFVVLATMSPMIQLAQSL